jgi:hypothetical protein
VCPESLVCLQQKTVRQLLSGSLTHTRTKSLSPTCVLHQMLRRALRVFSSYFSVSCYPPKMMSKKLTLVFSPLCRFTSPTPTPTTTTKSSALHLHLCRLSPFPGTGTTPRHVLTARCLSAAYPGIQQMVLYLLLILSPLHLQCHVHLLTH